MKKLFFILVLSLASLASFSQKLINIDGSSTVYPITEAVAEEFQKIEKNVKVTVGISGTGGGFKKFCIGETDISDASRPIKQSEIEVCQKNGIEYIELPVAFDGLAVVVNKKNNWVKYLTVEDLKKIWCPESEGKVKNWKDVNEKYPSKPLSLYGPGADSGTFDYFTEAICGKGGASRTDYTPSEDDNVLVIGVANTEGGLGYFGVAYYEENKDKIKLVPIHNGKEPVLPTLENVKNGTYKPLSRPLFIYINKNSAKKEEVKKFVEYYLSNASIFSKEVGYIPLPDEVYKLAKERFKKQITGTLFGGKAEIGMTLEELLKIEK
jgi:phosphate transport system substrate-binding protein